MCSCFRSDEFRESSSDIRHFLDTPVRVMSRLVGWYAQGGIRIRTPAFMRIFSNSPAILHVR